MGRMKATVATEAAKEAPEAKDATGDRSVEEVAIETLSGDIRDVILTRFRDIKMPWKNLKEDQQRDINYAMDELAKMLVRRVVALLTQVKFPTVYVEIGAFKIDKGVEIKMHAASTVDNIMALAEHGQGNAVLVLAEPSRYFEERAPAPVERDQPDLPGTDKAA